MAVSLSRVSAFFKAELAITNSDGEHDSEQKSVA